jgi:hypothetical protein
VETRGGYSKERLIEIYDRLLELYVLIDESSRRGDKAEAVRHQPEIDRLRGAMAQLKQESSS